MSSLLKCGSELSLFKVEQIHAHIYVHFIRLSQISECSPFFALTVRLAVASSLPTIFTIGKLAGCVIACCSFTIDSSIIACCSLIASHVWSDFMKAFYGILVQFRVSVHVLCWQRRFSFNTNACGTGFVFTACYIWLVSRVLSHSPCQLFFAQSKKKKKKCFFFFYFVFCFAVVEDMQQVHRAQRRLRNQHTRQYA